MLLLLGIAAATLEKAALVARLVAVRQVSQAAKRVEVHEEHGGARACPVEERVSVREYVGRAQRAVDGDFASVRGVEVSKPGSIRVSVSSGVEGHALLDKQPPAPAAPHEEDAPVNAVATVDKTMHALHS